MCETRLECATTPFFVVGVDTFGGLLLPRLGLVIAAIGRLRNGDRSRCLDAHV